MRVLCTLFVLAASLSAQTWTTICNGAASGTGSCPITGSSYPNARGFLNNLPYDTVNGEYIYYAASLNSHTFNQSIYSSEIWGYNASTRTFTYRTGNGATSITTGAGPTRCATEGSPADSYNPYTGHPQGYFDFDTVHNRLFATQELCGNYFAGWTFFYDASTHAFTTPVNYSVFSNGTQTGPGYNYNSLVWVKGANLAVYCCDHGNSTRSVIEYDGNTTYADVTSLVRGADSLSCATSAHCPPAPLSGAARISDNSGNLWIYGGCYGATPGETGSVNPCSGTNQNDIYKYNVATRTFTKIAPNGTKPPTTYASFPFAAFDTSGNRILLYAANNDMRQYDVATNTWSSITTSGSGPDYGDGSSRTLANNPNGNLAAYDTASNRFVVIYPSTNGQSTSPIVMDLTFGAASPSSRLKAHVNNGLVK